jgi:hypothetical protein
LENIARWDRIAVKKIISVICHAVVESGSRGIAYVLRDDRKIKFSSIPTF